MKVVLDFTAARVSIIFKRKKMRLNEPECVSEKGYYGE